MDDQKKDKLNEEILSRRSFLTGLGKWSAIVVAAAAVGVSEAMGSEDPKEEPYRDDDLPPGHEASSVPNDPDSIEPQWWRWRRGCRVWGNRGCRVWGNGGCRVWGNR
ncbi:MAG TPA: twin-arginine translocation signal domain-containing protein [Desulfomonilaceae bacterium]|nr:twin-arginine translocation signal domain-containing protein [Desulfomonilaceae bacterium]